MWGCAMQMGIPSQTVHYLFEPEDGSLPEFVVWDFSGQEEISQLSRFEIRLLASDPDVDFSKLLNKRAALRIWSWQDGGYTRAYHGIISSFRQVDQHELYAVFLAELVPLMWRLTLNHRSRIFQDKSVRDIVEEVLKDNGLQSDDYRMALQSTYEPLNKPPREFCVQYRESDFNFISRLMEEEGIFYFFEHGDSKETLVIADNTSVHSPAAPQSEVRYEKFTGQQALEEEFVQVLQYRENVIPARVDLKDFNYDTPQTQLFASSQLGQNGSFYVYDHPGRFGFLDRGMTLARIRNEELEAGRKTVSGEGNCRSFCVGYRVTVTDHPRADLNNEYLLTGVTHQGIQGGPLGTDQQTAYSNGFECIPASVPYRPPRIARKPFVQGTQTAIVVGPEGEEIYVDEKGRVKVQFHWDVEGEYDENSSCWVRVSQKWAGVSWGAMFIPRIGQEVVVDFLEGDPDQPLITGEVYNGDHFVPYPLPEEKTKSTVKSNSSKGGEGFNEIRLEDKKGEEQVFIHAEKNQDNRVKNDSLEWIGQDRHLIIKRDQMELVEGDKHLHVKGDQNEKVEGTISVQADCDMQEKVGAKYALDAGTEIHLKAGMNLVVESGASLTLKVGGSFVNLNPGGVFISGPMVMINSGGSAGSGAGSSPDTPKDPLEADTAEPGGIGKVPPPPEVPEVETPAALGGLAGVGGAGGGAPTAYSPAAMVLKQAAQDGTPFCEKCAAAQAAS